MRDTILITPTETKNLGVQVGRPVFESGVENIPGTDIENIVNFKKRRYVQESPKYLGLYELCMYNFGCVIPSGILGFAGMIAFLLYFFNEETKSFGIFSLVIGIIGIASAIGIGLGMYSKEGERTEILTTDYSEDIFEPAGELMLLFGNIYDRTETPFGERILVDPMRTGDLAMVEDALEITAPIKKAINMVRKGINMFIENSKTMRVEETNVVIDQIIKTKLEAASDKISKMLYDIFFDKDGFLLDENMQRAKFD